MKIKQIPLAEIKEYPKNSKIHTDDQINAVKNSIEKFGIQQPIVVDENNVIIIGHCRYKAAKSAGLTEFPCVVLHLTEQQANALRIIDNKTNESEWDYSSLYEEIQKLAEDIDLTELGFSLVDVLYADDVYEPENLDFEGEDEYVENAQSQLKSKQISISYSSEEEQEWLKSKLNADKLKVVYQAEQLMAE